MTRFPVVLVGEVYWGGLIEWLRTTALPGGKIRASDLELIHVTDDVDEVIAHIRTSAKRGSEQERNEQVSAELTEHDAQ